MMKQSMTQMKQSLYLHMEPADVGEIALLTGDPARVDRIAEGLDDARVVAQNREFYTVTGSYRGVQVLGVSSGIGAPSAAIAIEELAHLGVKAVVRVGTTMGVTAPMGAFVVSTGAVRYEGTSAAYLPLAYPAVPDWRLASCLVQAGSRMSQEVLTGITATYDAFYPHMAPSLVDGGELDTSELEQAGVLSLDMETALLYVLGLRLKIAVASMCIVTNQASPFAIIDGDARSQGERTLISAVLDGLMDWRGM